jgi:DNA polymerase III subunit delta
MRFIIYGEDSFRSRRKLSAAREQFTAKRDASGMNSLVFRPDQAEAAIEAIRTSPFMAEKKLVVLDGFLQSGAEMQRQIAEALTSQPDSTVVVFYENAGAESLSKSELFADLKSQQFSEEFPPLSLAAAEQFVVAEAEAAGVVFGQRAARLLVELVGTDSWQLHSETAKLAAYAAGQAKEKDSSIITEAMVRDMTHDGRDEPMFAFLDACADGRTVEAVQLLERLSQAGANEPQIVAMLIKHFRAAVAARDLIDRGAADAGMLARSIGLHPYVATKAIALARKHDLAVLTARLEKLIQMERAYKSGGNDPKFSLALFVA